MTLDDKYEKALEKWNRKLPLPLCPSCGGAMKHWDAWLVTGTTCKDCGWNRSEGSGCLA